MNKSKTSRNSSLVWINYPTMQVFQLLSVFFCGLFRCEYDFPSDPLQNQRQLETHPLISDRIGRDFSSNEVDSGEFLNPIVITDTGAVEGYMMKTIRGRSISAFEGIPYGEDTGGLNRFMPPTPKSNWTGIRNAKKPGEKCLQLHMVQVMQLTGSEDCLFLNVYTPAKFLNRQRQKKLPVLVYIHGGMFFFGAGSEYGPAYLLEHDIILVTFNYRMGIFGFLSTADEVLPGNLGHKDQVLALKWVRKNIKAFGGNPNQVTLTGQSSGAASVHFHMLSTLSRGLFARAISFSGNAYSSWAITNRNKLLSRNRKLARVSRCPQSPSEAFVRCLKRKSGRQLSFYYLRLYDILPTPPIPLGVVIEPNISGAFLDEHPDDIYARNGVARVPWICSRNTNESQAIFSALGLIGLKHSSTITHSLWQVYAPYFLEYQYIIDDVNIITDKLHDFYKKDKTIPNDGNIYTEIATDRLIGYSVHKSLQLHSQVAPTYSWLYAYTSRYSITSKLGLDPYKYGVSHTDDLTVYFNMSIFYTGYKTTDPEFKIVKVVTRLIADFASGDDPIYTDESRTLTRVWHPVTDPKNISVLLIDNVVKMIPEPHPERYNFWESIGLPDTKPFKLIK